MPDDLLSAAPWLAWLVGGFAVLRLLGYVLQEWRNRPTKLSPPSRAPLDRPEGVIPGEGSPAASPGTGMQVPEYRPDTLDRLADKKVYITFSALMAYNVYIVLTDDETAFQVISGMFLALGLAIVVGDLATRSKQGRSPADR